MSPRFTTDLPLVGMLGLSLLVTSCDKSSSSSSSASEVKNLRGQIANLQADIQMQKKAGQTERDTLAAENQALRATLQQLDPLRERAEKAEQETAQVRQQLAALQKKGAEASGQVPEAAAAPVAAAQSVGTTDSTPLPALAASGMPGSSVDKTLANRLLASVVIIKGDQSEGSGFFARQGGKTYLYTAAHVLSGNSKLDVRTTDGRVFTKFGAFEVAEAADMVRFTMLEEPPSAPPEVATEGTKVGHPVFAIGNSGGGGVLTILDGTVTGVGDESDRNHAGRDPGEQRRTTLHRSGRECAGDHHPPHADASAGLRPRPSRMSAALRTS
ncbi:MAG: trypsin-like peptidase domain-containing protein [Luteolibacter sp.]